MYEELSSFGFTIITVALDKNGDDARPYIEAAKPTHPSVIDSEHVVADLYGIINISTVIWIDEKGRVIRPAAIEYGSNVFKEFHGMDAGPHLDALRAWVKDGVLPPEAADVRSHQMPPTADEQLARAEFTLAWHLHRAGHAGAAERHFVRAGELAPLDWTIRRGSLPIRGMDPMGQDFFSIYQEWEASGKPGYQSEAQRRATR